MSNIEQELKKISNDLDRIELELVMNAEAIESIDMSIRFFQAELDYDLRGHWPSW
jgi:hypothetical protein